LGAGDVLRHSNPPDGFCSPFLRHVSLPFVVFGLFVGCSPLVLSQPQIRTDLLCGAVHVHSCGRWPTSFTFPLPPALFYSVPERRSQLPSGDAIGGSLVCPQRLIAWD